MSPFQKWEDREHQVTLTNMELAIIKAAMSALISNPRDAYQRGMPVSQYESDMKKLEQKISSILVKG